MNTTESEAHDPGNRAKATVALQTVGCKLNQAESEALARRFLDEGFSLVSPNESPDIFILNTCTVTHIADRKCRQYLRNFCGRNPNSLVVALGCYADRDAVAVGQVEGVDLVIGNAEKGRLVEIIEARLDLQSKPACDKENRLSTFFSTSESPCNQAVRKLLLTPSYPPLAKGDEGSYAFEGHPRSAGLTASQAPGRKHSAPLLRQAQNQALPESLFRTRAMIKIQDGCNHNCSYCIVPHVRGRERSVAAETVIAEIKARVGEGCNEVILTGTRIGAYDGVGGLEGLAQRILNETAVARLRLSSLQPAELLPSLIRLWKNNQRICRHLHLALQSGSDPVLCRMNRRYSTGEYFQKVAEIRDAMPDIAITTDVIVGFPGETEAQFEQSYWFCEGIGFADLHIFPYSARPGTPASRMADKVQEKFKKDRSRAMIDLAEQSSQGFRRRFIGKTMPVLWEEQKEGHLWIGHTGNYIKVVTRSNEPLANRLLQTELGIEHGDALWGNTPIVANRGEEFRKEDESS